MRSSARIESILAAIVTPLLRWAVVGMQVGLYATAVFTGVLAYGSFVAKRVYPFIETLLHFSLALLVATVVPLLFDLAVKRLRRRAAISNSRLRGAMLAILLSVCAVGAVFCLPLLEPIYDAGRAMIDDGLQGRLRSDDPARMPLSALMTFAAFTFFLLTGLLLSLRHSFGLLADLNRSSASEDPAFDHDNIFDADETDEEELLALSHEALADETDTASPWGPRSRHSSLRNE
ncbi:hypothetical protein NIM86_06280 [Notoacmeibacter sp. MSK16QG-6]|nr:hypothetical protein [Notoacmeibacter sp. MSK16QG-6]